MRKLVCVLAVLFLGGCAADKRALTRITRGNEVENKRVDKKDYVKE